MNLPQTLVLVTLFAACGAAAQQPVANLAPPPTPAVPAFDGPLTPSLLTTEPQTTRQDVIAGKSLQVSGPLVHPLKAKRIWTIPLKLAQLLNPFAKSAAKMESEPVDGVSPRAWTTVVGWHPGASMFPDPKTDHLQLPLISLSGTAPP